MKAQNLQGKTHSQSLLYPHRALLIFCIFMAVGALFGGVGALVAPVFFGATDLVPIFQELPYVGQYITSLAIPAFALLLLMCIPHSIATILLLKNHSLQYLIATVCGIFLIIFTAVELLIIPNPASWLFFFFGFAETALGIICLNAIRL